MTQNEISEFETALLSLDKIGAREIIDRHLTSRSVMEIIDGIVTPALDNIGSGWENGTTALAQVYMGGKICENIIISLLPPSAPERTSQPPMAIAAFEDQHMLGLRIVFSLLRSNGFELKNYGSVNTDSVIGNIKKDRIKILLLSTLMLPSALHIKNLRDRLDEENINVKIIVGGAPYIFDRKLWKDIGADAMCSNAAQAVQTVNNIMGRL